MYIKEYRQKLARKNKDRTTSSELAERPGPTWKRMMRCEGIKTTNFGRG